MIKIVPIGNEIQNSNINIVYKLFVLLNFQVLFAVVVEKKVNMFTLLLL